MSKGKYNNPFTATFNGILDLFKKQTPIGSLSSEDRIDGKTCLVTGANSGLGFAVANQLIERGGKVILACRSQLKETEKLLLEKFKPSQFQILHVDLSNIKSIDSFLTELRELGIQIDIAVFNAAMVPNGSKQLANGLDEMFMVNYLSKFYLVNRLLDNDIIKKNPAIPSRLIFVSSESHRTNQALDFENFGNFKEYSIGSVISLYGYYKLALGTFAKALHKRLQEQQVGVHVYALCPGPVNSNIARSAPKFFIPLLKLVFGIFFSSPQKAAKPVVFLACAPQLNKKDYVYLHLMQEKEMDEKALDVENGEKLWQKSVEILESIPN